jgi:hypothetical protein
MPTPTLANEQPGEPRQRDPGALLGTIAALREHCPWMGALTHESLVEYLLEEAYEVAETIDRTAGAGNDELRGASWAMCCSRWCCTPGSPRSAAPSISTT